MSATAYGLGVYVDERGVRAWGRAAAGAYVFYTTRLWCRSDDVMLR
jgi:hypothetical protein